MLHELPAPSSDGSFQIGPHLPLRIVRNGDHRELASSSAWEMIGSDESVVMSTFPNMPETVRFTITDKLFPAPGFLPFVRDILYTRAGDKRIMTMSGYLASYKIVQVVGELTKEDRDDLSERERARLAIAESIELEHIQGFDAVVARHRERVGSLEIIPADMREAQQVYDALV